MARYWYAYNAVGDPYSAASYRRQTTIPGCLNGPLICAIYSPGGSVFPPPLSDNIKQYITNGLANNIAEPAIPAGSKFFVYLKGTSF